MTVIAAGKDQHGFGKWELHSWDGAPYLNFEIEDHESFTHDVSLDHQSARTLHTALGEWLEQTKEPQ